MPKLPTILGPLLLLAVYGIILYLFRGYLNISDLLVGVTALYAKYGYMVVFVAAFIESSFPIGLYVPGSTAVLLGAALSRNGTLQFPLVYLLATSGLVLGYCLNYTLGKYGWYHMLTWFGIDKGIGQAQKKLERYGNKAIIIGYFWPGGASFLSTAAGVLKMPFRKFLLLSIVAQGLWTLLWGGLSYLFGLTLVEFLFKYAFLFMGIGIIYLGVQKFRKKT